MKKVYGLSSDNASFDFNAWKGMHPLGNFMRRPAIILNVVQRVFCEIILPF